MQRARPGTSQTLCDCWRAVAHGLPAEETRACVGFAVAEYARRHGGWPMVFALATGD